MNLTDNEIEFEEWWHREMSDVWWLRNAPTLDVDNAKEACAKAFAAGMQSH